MPCDTVIIANPAAGSAEIRQIRAYAEQRENTQLRPTEKAGDESRLAAAACDDGARTIIAAGGDGTIHGVVNGLAEHLEHVRLGIIPMGSANDFATSLGLPATVPEALEALTSGRAAPIDLLRVTTADGAQKLLINAATAGFSGAVHDFLEDEPEKKAFWGRLAYLRAALDALSDLPHYQTTLTADDSVIDLRVCALIIANGGHAGGVTLAPEAAPDDQWIDIGMVVAETPAEMAGLGARIAFGTPFDSDYVISRRARHIRIASRPPMPFIGDGEPLGDTPIEFDLMPRALRLIVPHMD